MSHKCSIKIFFVFISVGMAIFPAVSNARGGLELEKEIFELGRQIETVSFMKQMLAVDIAIKRREPCSTYEKTTEYAKREMKRLNADTNLSQSEYDNAYNHQESVLKEYRQKFKQCFRDNLPFVARDYPNVLSLGAIGYDEFERKYTELKKPFYGNKSVESWANEQKSLEVKREKLIVERLEEGIKEVRDFRGVDETLLSRDRWQKGIVKQLNELVEAANSYPGIDNKVVIAGETQQDRDDGIVRGFLKQKTGFEKGRFVQLLSGDDLPPQHRHNNPYAAWTAAYEEPLRQKILRTPTYSLFPGDVLKLALDACKGNYPLAVMTAHSVLKVATKEGRSVIEKMTARGRMGHWKKAFELAAEIKPHSEIALRLRGLRPADDKTGDKLGPWYHGFGLLSAGALSSPEGAVVGGRGEHFIKWLGWFVGEGGYNPEKAYTDKIFASAAMSLTHYNRYYDPAIYYKVFSPERLNPDSDL